MITCNFSLSGIKEFRAAYLTNYGAPITFPIIPTYNLTTGNIICSQYSDLITIGGITTYAIPLKSDFGSFTEELTMNDAGTYYTRTINFNSIYDTNLEGLLDNKFVVFFLKDNNNINWVIGFDNPMKLMTYSLNSGITMDGQDSYNLVYTSKSYNTIKKYELQ